MARAFFSHYFEVMATIRMSTVTCSEMSTVTRPEMLSLERRFIDTDWKENTSKMLNLIFNLALSWAMCDIFT